MWRAVFAAAVVLWASAAGLQAQTTAPDSVTFTLDQARVFARRALDAGRFKLARDLAMGLLKADPEDPYAYGILAAAHIGLDDPKLARAAARLSYSYSDTSTDKFSAARNAAFVAYRQERYTYAQGWLRVAAAHADGERQKALLARDYRKVRTANPFSFTLDVSISPSDNVNSGTDNVIELVNGVPTSGRFAGSSRSLSGVVGIADLRLRYRLARSKDSQTTALARIYTRRVTLSNSAKDDAPNVSGSDFASSFLEAGLAHDFALGARGNSAQIAGAFGASWYGGDRTYDFAKIELTRRVRLTKVSRLSFTGAYEKRFSAFRSKLDRDVVRLGATYRHKFKKGDKLTLSVIGQDVSGESINASYQTVSVRARYKFKKKLGPAQIATGVTYGYTDYDNYTLLSAVEGGRRDDSIYGDVSAFFPDYDFAGFAPTVTLRSGKRTSNVNRFEIDETTLTVGIQSKF